MFLNPALNPSISKQQQPGSMAASVGSPTLQRFRLKTLPPRSESQSSPVSDNRNESTKEIKNDLITNPKLQPANIVDGLDKTELLCKNVFLLFAINLF